MPDISQDERDKLSPVWDMSQERVFIETLVNQRLNFFLVIFSFVIAGAINSKIQLFFQIILFLGATLCSLLACTIYRSNRKLDKIFERLKKDWTHPLTIIDNETKGVSVRWIIGKAIPIGCSIFLWLSAILSLFNIAKVPDTSQFQSQPKQIQRVVNNKVPDTTISNKSPIKKNDTSHKNTSKQ